MAGWGGVSAALPKDLPYLGVCGHLTSANQVFMSEWPELVLMSAPI